MISYTKDLLINRFQEIKNMGWILSQRPGNAGAVGNTLEDLLGIEENNLPLPNAGEWELKANRRNSSALQTLFHSEPSPRAFRFVPQILLLKYGWRHNGAGDRYPENEMSFRATISGNNRTDRGFGIIIDEIENIVSISFDSSMVDERHSSWLTTVNDRVGHLNELNPMPYWGFSDLGNIAGSKLVNCFFINADAKRENGLEYFHYQDFYQCESFSFRNFLDALRNGNAKIDFDARTGHNHGTKFRIRKNARTLLYENTTRLNF